MCPLLDLSPEGADSADSQRHIPVDMAYRIAHDRSAVRIADYSPIGDSNEVAIPVCNLSRDQPVVGQRYIGSICQYRTASLR